LGLRTIAVPLQASRALATALAENYVGAFQTSNRAVAMI
jgi:hypothetical protein